MCIQVRLKKLALPQFCDDLAPVNPAPVWLLTELGQFPYLGLLIAPPHVTSHKNRL